MALSLTGGPPPPATSIPTGQLARPRTRNRRWLLRFAVVVIVGAVFFFPFYWLVISSLEPQSEILSFPPRFFPGVIQIANYTKSLAAFPFLQGLGNTLIIIVGVEVGQLISVPIAAYAFARLDFPLRRILFAIVLGTLMIPYYVTIVPQYLIFRDLGWLNTFLPLTVPSLFGFGGAFYIFLFRQFFMSIPKEYDDAAMIDGCGRLGVFWHIILPQAKPALAVMAIFTFVAQWNDFFGPLIYLTSSNKFTLALDFYAFQQQVPGLQPQPANHVLAIATLITIVPVAIFFAFQRYFMRGIVVSGVQG
ncbi:MAG TPA: carbohydrate ABC transporter permease [Acidobacteriaceae bacterium]|nr:carbohydrate ABC transporter permease [Acidobacteriaceae bacterium]